MTRPVRAMTVALSLLLAPGVGAATGSPKFPVIGGKAAVATVNGEPIPLDELARGLSDIHQGTGDNVTALRSDPTQLLDRLINVRLVVQEARTIGLDELPEVQSAIQSYKEDSLRATLLGRHARTLRTPDRKEVERIYRQAVKEVKLASVLFGNHEKAAEFEAEVKAGGRFETLAKRLIDAGEARGSAEGEYMRARDLLPVVRSAVGSMKKGEVSPLLQIGKDYSMVKLLDVRFPESPDARKEAEREALQAKRGAAARDYVEVLTKRYVKVNERLLKELDYDAPEPGFDSYLADTRVLAEVKGGKPVTVMELSGVLQKRFYHGTKGAAEKGRINRMKARTLHEIVAKRAMDLEAKRLKLDRTEAYRNDVEEHRRGVLFGTFVQKVIEPGIRLDEQELRAYREEHLGDYTSPGMIRLAGIAFSEREDAEKAMERLRDGAEFEWVRANADGRLEPGTTGAELVFTDIPVVTRELPEALQNTLSGAASGEYRLYSSPGGAHYILAVRDVIPPAPQPFDSVREEIAKKVFEKQRREALVDYLGKLRAAADIKIFADGKALGEVLRRSAK